MTSQRRMKAFRELAERMNGMIDLTACQETGQDWKTPIIGQGNSASALAFFGRDPGREEVHHQQPFIGAAGQLVRAVLYEHRHGSRMPDFSASKRIGQDYFWANTVPYKPSDNKPWSMAIKRRFQPLVADLLLHAWQGDEVITLGREAFFWFAINQPREIKIKSQLKEFWQRSDRFSKHTTITLSGPDGRGRSLRLHPLPHPSPQNATWYKRFPGLLRARLEQLSA